MSHGDSHSPPRGSATPPKPEILRGWIKTTEDALIVLEATRLGIVPRVTRRFHELEKRSIIQSGAIFVFTEEESGIKRWTDPYLWSASRMQGNFLMYREREDEYTADTESPYRCSALAPLKDDDDRLRDPDLEHYILGSWNKGKGLKQNGLMKKTTSMTIEDTTYHLISYYYPSDVRSGCLKTPSEIPHLSHLDVSSIVIQSVPPTRHMPVNGKGKRGRSTRSSRNVRDDHSVGQPMTIPSTPVSVIKKLDSPTTTSGLLFPASWPGSKINGPSGFYDVHTIPRSQSAPRSEIHHSLRSSNGPDQGSPSPGIDSHTTRSHHTPLVGDSTCPHWQPASYITSPFSSSYDHGLAAAGLCDVAHAPKTPETQEYSGTSQSGINRHALLEPYLTNWYPIYGEARPSTTLIVEENCALRGHSFYSNGMNSTAS